MNRQEILDLLVEHGKVVPRGDHVECKCGTEMEDVRFWMGHMADELDRAFRHSPRVIPSRRSDPSTSHSSAASVTMRAGSQRARLLEAFGRMRDATDEEAMFRAEGVSMRTEFSKRCSELREVGFIEPTGETRPGASGHQRIVSAITEEGRRWLETH